MKSIIYIVLFLSIYFGLCTFISINIALVVFSVIMATLATVFLVKKDFYMKYIEVINPKYAVLYHSKDADFRKKHKITDIIVLYGISAFLLFFSIALPNTTLPFQRNNIIYLIIGAMLSVIVLWQFSLYILKKSNKNASFWFYFTAFTLSVVLLLDLVQHFIY